MCSAYDEKVSCFQCIYFGHIKLVLNAGINVLEARNKRSLIYELAVRPAFCPGILLCCRSERFFDYGFRSNFFNRFVLFKQQLCIFCRCLNVLACGCYPVVLNHFATKEFSNFFALITFSCLATSLAKLVIIELYHCFVPD